MKFVTVTEAPSESEALMYKEMLESSGIKAVVTLPANQQFLRSNAGGAAMPFNVWEIKVAEANVERAKDILPITDTEAVHNRRVTTSPAARSFALFWLTTIILGLALALKEMINYFSGNKL